MNMATKKQLATATVAFKGKRFIVEYEYGCDMSRRREVRRVREEMEWREYETNIITGDGKS